MSEDLKPLVQELTEFAEWSAEKAKGYAKNNMEHLCNFNDGQSQGYRHSSSIAKPHEARWLAKEKALRELLQDLEEIGGSVPAVQRLRKILDGGE